MKKNRTYLAYITARNGREARLLGRALVRERLAACVNILGDIECLYRWKGKLETGREVALIAKTTAAQSKKLTARVRKLHSYSCPCVVILPIEGGNPDFIKWIQEETG